MLRSFSALALQSPSCSDLALATVLLQGLAGSETSTGPFPPALS